MDKIKMYKESRDKTIRNEIIEDNLNLVHSIVNKYFSSFNQSTKEELFQEGIIEFMNSIEKYDETKGYKLTTYAYSNIIQVLKNYLSRNNNTFYKPRHFIENENKVRKFQKDFLNKNCEEATRKDILEGLKIEEKLLDLILFHQIEAYRLDNTSNITKYKNSGEKVLMPSETISINEEEIEDNIIKTEQQRKIMNYIKKTFNRDYQQIFKMRSGLNKDHKVYTIEEIAKTLNCSKQNVSQKWIRLKDKLSDFLI